MFGDSLLVGAFTETIYLPDGEWIDYWTGARYTGGPFFIRPFGQNGDIGDVFLLEPGAVGGWMLNHDIETTAGNNDQVALSSTIHMRK
ncbi:hypothetical protein IDH45_05940 [Paenibacillus sp. IB182363]|uniref:Glycosyl hydrolase family 31 C-terminal domain-containing protein n=2 Tax=Paenibacillus oceani TaxID=2772510 RepID=A0A927GYF0_9BACL|nr:hypothetical protein [Paenibacillus oceani]